MKEQVQEPGVRKWFGDDFINLQTEQTDAAKALFSDFGNAVISGAGVTNNGNGTYTIAAGIAFLLDSTGANGKLCRITTRIFAAANFPVYLVQASIDSAAIGGYGRLYKDGNSKNIVVEYFGNLVTVNPGHANYLSFTTATVSRRYRDAIQDSGYRFVTDTDKNNWNGKANQTNPAFSGTPTGLTKTHVGLNLVDNTADASKPVSTAQLAALNSKASINNPDFTGRVSFPSMGQALTIETGTNDGAEYAGANVNITGWNGLAMVNPTMGGAFPSQITGLYRFRDGCWDTKGYPRVDGTSIQTIFAPLINPAFTGTPTGITKAHVGLGNVDNESKVTMFTNPAFAGNINLGTGLYVSGSAPNTFNAGYNTNGASDIWINYKGYLDGLTQFRDFIVGNGKGVSIANFVGSTGRVGIGTATPGCKLDVNGEVRATDFIIS